MHKIIAAAIAAAFPIAAHASSVAQQLDAGQTVTLSIPNFSFNQSTVPPAGAPTIQQAADYQRRSGELLRVDGYSDRLGNKRHDHRLSQKRADAVKRALIHDGAAPSKIEARGKGIRADKTCHQHSRAALINCLSKDRRVDIFAPERLAAAKATKAAPVMAANVPAVTVTVTPVPAPKPVPAAIVEASAPKPAQPANPHAFAIVLSSQGPRYAGSEVLTLAGGGTWKNVGWNGSITEGIPSSHTNSTGGRYTGLSGGLSHKLGDGVIAIDGLHATYLQGGPVAPLGLSGTLTRGDLSYSHAIIDNLDGTVKLGRVSQVADMQIVNLSDSETYRLANLSLTWAHRWSKTMVLATAAYERGLGGSRSNGGADLLGIFDPHYQLGTLDLTFTQAMGSWTVQAKAGGQTGSVGTPQASQLIVGGPGRGAVADTGIYSGPRGYYTSITLNAPPRAGYQPYIGLDRASMALPTGQRQSLQSAQAGIRYAAGAVSGGVEVAHELGHNNGLPSGDNRVNFFVSVAF